jgi:hypothetical protein
MYYSASPINKSNKSFRMDNSITDNYSTIDLNYIGISMDSVLKMETKKNSNKPNPSLNNKINLIASTSLQNYKANYQPKYLKSNNYYSITISTKIRKKIIAKNSGNSRTNSRKRLKSNPKKKLKSSKKIKNNLRTRKRRKK